MKTFGLGIVRTFKTSYEKRKKDKLGGKDQLLEAKRGRAESFSCFQWLNKKHDI